LIYSDLVRKACNILYEAHKMDVDKGGYPYVFHPFFLASQMNDEASVCVALLHDVIEDHGDRYSFAMLEKEGFPPEVLDALRLLTHDKDVPYMDYIERIAENPIACKVKLADLRHNSDTSRTGGKISPKYDTYQQAITYLEVGRKKYTMVKKLPNHTIISRFDRIENEEQLKKSLGALRFQGENEKSGLWALLGKTDQKAKKWICIEVGHSKDIQSEIRSDMKAMFWEPETICVDTAFHEKAYSYPLHMEKTNFKYRTINRRFARFKLILINVDDYLQEDLVKSSGITLPEDEEGRYQLAEVLFAMETKALFWNPAPKMNGNREREFLEKLGKKPGLNSKSENSD